MVSKGDGVLALGIAGLILLDQWARKRKFLESADVNSHEAAAIAFGALGFGIILAASQ